LIFAKPSAVLIQIQLMHKSKTVSKCNEGDYWINLLFLSHDMATTKHWCPTKSSKDA